MNNKITPADARLIAARRAFEAKLARTPEKHRRAVVEVAAAKAIGTGPDEVDPLTSAIARKMADSYKLADSVEAAKEELARLEPLTRRAPPGDPGYRGRAFARKAYLEQSIDENLARYVGLQEAPLDSAERKATEFFQKVEADEQRFAQRKEALARAEAAAEQEELDGWAERLVAAKRANSGKSE
jgi:hypothetical protein